MGIDYHLHGKIRAELRNPQYAQPGTADLIRRNPQGVRILEQAHHVLSVQRDGQRIPSGHILQHTDHGGIIVPEDVQLEQVMINGMVIKMGSHDVCRHIVRRMLHRRKGIDILSDGQNHDTAGMLPRTSAHPRHPHGEPLYLALAAVFLSFLEIIFHIAESRLVRQRCDGSRPVCLAGAEDDLRIFVGLGLVLSGEIQINIRLLISLEAQEGLKGDIKSVFVQFFPAHRTVFIRHVNPGLTGICFHVFALKIHIMTLTAIIMGT